MARKLSSLEKEIFEQIARDADPASIELSAEAFLKRLREQQQRSLSPSQLALWLSEDPLAQQ